MDIARYFIEKKVTSWMVTLIMLIGGGLAFLGLGRLEDPEFSIKVANIITQYPGATPQQVEDEVTYVLEKEMQNLPYVDLLESTSSAGFSKIRVELKDNVRSDTINQVWDEVRKKIRDISSQLPSGASTPTVVDDFGDVYGILFELVAAEPGTFENSELDDIATDLSKELALVDGVSKVTVDGDQQQQVRIEIPTNTLVNMGISVDQIAGLLSGQNVVSNAGHAHVGPEYVRITTTGEFNTVDELGLLTITSTSTGQTVKLKDIATITRSYAEPSQHIIHYDGKDAVALGVSFLPGVNVVEVGDHIRTRLAELQSLIPEGVEMNPIYYQSDEVHNAVSGFLLSLLQAIVIVIVVLLVFMGLRSGLLIGLILAITIFGTFILMDYAGITLQRISLGGLIIALGMLVDNAIVVTEGILIGLKRGKTKLQAASEVVRQNQWPLLGATVIAIMAFAPIGLSPDAIGEFVGSLFWVLLISLLISWFTAVTLTPFFCDLMFKEEIKNGEEGEETDPYKGIIFTVYKKVLLLAMTFRVATVILLVAALAGALYSFGFVKQAFFPSSSTPIFFIEMRYPASNSIEATEVGVHKLEDYLLADDRVDYVTSSTAQGFPRFLLTYNALEFGSDTAQLIVRTHKVEDIDPLIKEIHDFLENDQPELTFALRRLQLGPGSGSKLEVRFSGPDPQVLRDLAEQAKAIYRSESNIEGVFDDWKDRVKILQPVFDAERASQLGITKDDYDTALLRHQQGTTVGTFRDGTDILPIIMTVPEDERTSVNQLKDIQIYTNGEYVNITEITERFDVIWDDPLIQRRDRQRTITAKADPHINSPLNADQLFKKTRPMLEAIELPRGYEMEFGGEYEDSKDARDNMTQLLPMGYLIMFIITVLLFNSVRETLVVWLCIPMTIIGISTGLLVLNVPFGFMGFLGFLSLSGMVIKNGIVLLEQVNIEHESGKDQFSSMFDAAVSRLRPVVMAALTTILGLTPLLGDPFFQDMAVVISFGLGFATVLTLVAVPVFYCLFFGVRRPKEFKV